jgi:hypothetical protein
VLDPVLVQPPDVDLEAFAEIDERVTGDDRAPRVALMPGRG